MDFPPQAVMNTFARRRSCGPGSAKRAAPGSGAHFKARVESRDYCSIGRVPSGSPGSACGASGGDTMAVFAEQYEFPKNPLINVTGIA